jgi:hypothetical protein
MKYIKIKLKPDYRAYQPAFDGIFIVLEDYNNNNIRVQPATYSRTFDGLCPSTVLSSALHADITEVIND